MSKEVFATCANCSRKQPAGERYRYCGHCGSQMEGNLLLTYSEVPNYCPTCGELALRTTDKYCVYCGSPTRDGSGSDA